MMLAFQSEWEMRYEGDAEFHALVDTLEKSMDAAQFTAGELRAAAILAAIHYEYRNPRPVRIKLNALPPPECGTCLGPDCEGCTKSAHWYWFHRYPLDDGKDGG